MAFVVDSLEGVAYPHSMDQATDKDIRFCPYCAQMQFEVTGKDERALVYCELCGVDVAVYELIQ